MKNLTIEQRLAALERTVEQLQRELAERPPEKDWRRTVGMFTGDEVMKRIDEAGLAWRESERTKARKKQRTKRKARA